MSAEEQTLQTPEPQAPAAAPPVEPPKVDKNDLRAVVSNAVKNPQQRGQHAQFQPREQGKFAGAPQFPKPNGEVTPVAAPAVQRPAMPKSLKLELQKHWDAIPETNYELLNAINQRETDYQKGFEPYKQAKQQLDELLNEFKPYEMLMRAENATPKTTIANLLQTAALFRTGSPVQKAQGVAQLMNQFGIPFQHVQQFLSGNAPQVPLAQPAVDPRLQQLTQQVQQITEFQQKEAEAKTLAAVNGFFEDPKHKYLSVEGIPEQVATLVQLPPETLGLDSTASEVQKLEAAYELAIWRHPEVRKQMIAEQQAPQSQQGQVERAKQAAVQVKGAPISSPGQKVDPKDLRGLLSQQFQQRR